jgi:hypothetical protein
VESLFDEVSIAEHWALNLVEVRKATPNEFVQAGFPST